MSMVANRLRVWQLAVAIALLLTLALALVSILSHAAPAAGHSLAPAGTGIAYVVPHPYCVATMSGC